MTTTWKPTGYSSVSSYLGTTKAQVRSDFLSSTVGATQFGRHENEDGSIMHAEVRLEDTVIALGTAPEGWPSEPCHLHVRVPDVDRTYEAALANGGDSVQAPVRKGDSNHRCGVMGPGGNTWWFSTQAEGRVQAAAP